MRCTLLIVLGAMLTGPAPVVAQAAPPAAQPAGEDLSIPWSELDFRARKLLLTASTMVRVTVVPAAVAAASLRDAPGGSPVPVSREVAVLTLQTDLPFGRNETVTMWVDPTNGAAQQFEKRQTGSSAYRKLIRYTDGGYVSWRWAPRNDGEARQGPQAWSKRKQAVFRAKQPPPPGAVVSDSYALLYLISVAHLEREGKRLAVYLYSDEHVVQLSFESLGIERRDASFVEVRTDGQRVRQGRVATRHVRVWGRALDNHTPDREVDLGFLGMRGELAIYLDAETGVPLEVVGQTESIGTLRVFLERAYLTRAAEAPSLAER